MKLLQVKRKEKVTLQKSYIYRVNNRMGQKKYLAIASATVEAKYDREWFIGELVVNNQKLMHSYTLRKMIILIMSYSQMTT